jgi:CheY-like chemotaxis protein
MITKKMLENKGVTCEVIDNGEDAIEVAKNQSFDLILMDIHLPGINGTIAHNVLESLTHYSYHSINSYFIK